MGEWTSRLDRLGIVLPSPAKPVGAYVPAVRSGNLVYTSGQLPLVDGRLSAPGKVGGDVTVEQANAAARLAGINALAAVHDLVGLDSVVRIVKVNGFVASAAGFTDQAKVLNGASELFGEIFGEAGVHARAAVGVFELPLGSSVEVELIAEVSV